MYSVLDKAGYQSVSNALKILVFSFQYITRKTVLDRGSRSDRPRYHAHTRWTPPLPLASASPRRTPRRGSAQLMTWQNPTTTAVDQYSWRRYRHMSGTHFCTNLNLWPWLSIPASYGHDLYV